MYHVKYMTLIYTHAHKTWSPSPIKKKTEGDKVCNNQSYFKIG